MFMNRKHKLNEKYCKATDAAEITLKCNTTTNKMKNISIQLNEKGDKVPTPTQSAIYKAADKLMHDHVESLSEIVSLMGSLTFHFDGKRIKKFHGNNTIEVLVILVSDQENDACISVKCLLSDSAENIFNAIVEADDKIGCGAKINRVVCDTTAVNTGLKWCCAKADERMAKKRFISASIFRLSFPYTRSNFAACKRRYFWSQDCWTRYGS